MAEIKAAAEAMFEAKSWETFIALIEAVVEVIFGYVASEEEIDYTPVA